MRADTRLRRPYALVLSSFAIILVAALMANAAGASTPRGPADPTGLAQSLWHVQKTPNPQVKDEVFQGTSCVSESFCVAVGYRLNDDNEFVALAELWNGTDWETMSTPDPEGSGQPSLESVSCASTADCVAVGDDVVDRGGEQPLAESWDGTSWKLDSVPSATLGGDLEGVSCPTAGECVAVGVGFNSSGLEIGMSDSWDGSTWVRVKVAQPSGNSGTDLTSVSCTSEDACTAVGGYEGGGEEGSTLAESWTGESWVIQKTPNPKGSSYTVLISVSCTSPADCIAVGLASPIIQPGPNSLGESWNGTTWTIMSTPNPNGSEGTQLNGVSCASSTACIAVGEYFDSAGVNATLAMSWDGATWTIVASPSPSAEGSSLAAVSCASPSACTAVGNSFVSKSPSILLVEHWDGEAWSTQKADAKPGVTGAGLSGVACLSKTFCLAVGNDEFFSPISEIWNGSVWKVTPAPAGSGGGELNDVTCVNTTDCIAVGSPSGSEIGLAERWDGQTWTDLKTPNGTGNLESVSCTSATSCMSVGTTEGSSQPLPVPLAESWDGQKWSMTQIPNPAGSFQADVRGISCPSADDCVAVGESLNDLQVASPLIYSWNGTKWTIETSAGASLSNLGLTGVSCTSPSSCLVVGYAVDRLGSPEAFSEVWNGSTWTSEKIPTPHGGAEPDGVQCSSATACVTVGARSRGALAEGWDGTGWTIEKTTTPVGAGTSAALVGVTCASSVTCTAVGSYSNSSGLELTLAEAT